MQHRSISQRLTRAKSPEAKKATLNEWLESWAESNEKFCTDTLAGYDVATDWREDNAKRIAAIPAILQKLYGKPYVVNT